MRGRQRCQYGFPGSLEYVPTVAGAMLIATLGRTYRGAVKGACGSALPDDPAQPAGWFRPAVELIDGGLALPAAQRRRAFAHQRRTAIDQSRVQLHQRGAGFDLGLRVGAGENAADADDR